MSVQRHMNEYLFIEAWLEGRTPETVSKLFGIESGDLTVSGIPWARKSEDVLQVDMALQVPPPSAIFEIHLINTWGGDFYNIPSSIWGDHDSCLDHLFFSVRHRAVLVTRDSGQFNCHTYTREYLVDRLQDVINSVNRYAEAFNLSWRFLSAEHLLAAWSPNSFTRESIKENWKTLWLIPQPSDTQ